MNTEASSVHAWLWTSVNSCVKESSKSKFPSKFSGEVFMNQNRKRVNEAQINSNAGLGKWEWVTLIGEIVVVTGIIWLLIRNL